MTMQTLRDVAKAVKSANAGASWLTLDIVMRDADSYQQLVDAEVITPKLVSELFQVGVEDVQLFECPQILTLKLTLPRQGSGGAEETDFDGVQYFVPLLDVAVPQGKSSQASNGGPINDESIGSLQQWLHVARPVKGWNSVVTPDAVRHFAQGIGDDNPMWWDEAYARTGPPGRHTAPPTFLYSCSNGSGGSDNSSRMHPAESWLPGSQSVWLSDRWEFFRPTYVGEPVFAAEELVDVSERESSRYGRMVTVVDRTMYRGADGDIIAQCDKTMLRRRRIPSPPSDIPVRTLEAEDVVAITNHYLSEAVDTRRGRTPRTIRDVSVGDRLPVLLKGPLTITNIVGWMLGWGSPMASTNRMLSNYLHSRPGAAITHPAGLWPDTIEATHWDRDLAPVAGFSQPYDFGAQRISWAAHLLTDWCGDSGFVRELDARLRRPNVLGDVTSFTGVITDVDSSSLIVTCEVTATNQRDEITLTATAKIQLPSGSDA
ncbi:DUF4387 family protein [Rhodococcus sp. NPDC059968]|uniref:DUF4387 family protein n=1 Tax=Rhodococcus sp. NPDC059968 TaxID=3347017 RepID=UPI0036706875